MKHNRLVDQIPGISFLQRSDAAKYVSLATNKLTDETGVKLARCLAASSTIETLNLAVNQLGEATYLAVAAALRVNTSAKVVHLFGNLMVDQPRIEAAFIEALRLNPDRPAQSDWWLCADSIDCPYTNDFKRLKPAAEQLGHPSLQMLLVLMC